mmetsp:Transcript_6199/g.18622  ORF Transcript_6199/g.18622 Transcript_6199/m.18622 type:complete len:271 (+) Transcript_6199:155-967(+)
MCVWRRERVTLSTRAAFGLRHACPPPRGGAAGGRAAANRRPPSSAHLAADGGLERRELRRPLVERAVLFGVGRLVGEEEERADLVDVAVDVAVEDERDEKLLHLALRDVELARDEGEADARVRLDDAQQDLRADVLEQVVEVHLDECVAHDGRVVALEDALELADLVVHVRGEQVGHREDLGVVLVRLGLLRVEGRDVRVHEHVGEDEVLEALDPPPHPGLVVVLEGVEKVVARRLPLAERHVHLAAALSDHAHDLGVGDSRLDLQRLLV